MKTILNLYLFFQFFNIRHVYSTMSFNCLQTLNTSDCNESPTNVFSYYKPGSRCELEVWRGCPTGNKFDTEEECSESCIFKAVVFERKGKSNAKCLSPEDLTNCKENATQGFKYDQLLIDCVEMSTNCPGNIFEDKLECIQTCVRDLTWDEKMKLISSQQSKELDIILDSLGNSTEKEEESTQMTDFDETKTSNEGKTDDASDTKTATVSTIGGGGGGGGSSGGDKEASVTKVEESKLKGDDVNTTTPYETKVTDSNSTSAGNETVSIKNEGTTVAIDNNANITSIANNSSTVQHDTTEKNIITTMKIGT